jgi:hypothetical protein
MASAIVVPVVALILIAGEGGELPPGPDVSVDRLRVPVGSNISGTAEGAPVLVVYLLVDSVVVDSDDVNEDHVNGRSINDFSFPAKPEYEGKNVVVRAIDGHGQVKEQTVTVTPQGG